MNLFDLFVTIGLKDEASGKIPGIGNALKTGLATAGKVAAVGIGAATTAVAALTKTAVEGYSEYEQLTGGVETLFKSSADDVMAYAENAYKTSGLSANEYMSTVTSFSASLLQSLGGNTEEAARMADQAITDMADNANKMGTDMAMIQNAYSGFAKQNFTMLDNLKLGYGGTQQEMKRLLEDAQAISGIEYDISSYADIVDAIHVIQNEMGITGTTAREASETIGGSVAAMKSAWQNLTVGIADENANIDELMDNFLNSVSTVASNILPVVERILENIFNTLAENGPEILKGAIELFLKIAVGAVQAIPGIVQSIPEIIEAIVGAFVDSWPEIKEVGKEIVRGVWKGIASLAGWLKQKVSDFVGGIVSNVKGVLGIHSPSRVFASIGENMALGLGNGWDDEYTSIKRGITQGLDFGAAKIGVNASGSVNRYSEVERPVNIVVQSVLDGKVIGETAYQYGVDRQRAYGGAY
jgi:phage-related protein